MFDVARCIPIAFVLEWRRFWREPLFYLLAFSRPVIWLLLLSSGLLFLSSNESQLLVAIVTYACVFTGITSAFSLTWERDRGLLRLWLGFRLPSTSYVIGKYAFALVMIGLILMASVLVCVPFVALDVPLLIEWRPIAGILLLATLTSTLGLAVASMVTRLDLFGAIINIILFPMLFTSGALYSVEDQSGPAAFVARINPLRMAVDVLREAMIEPSEFVRRSEGIAVLVISVVLGLIAVIGLRRES